MKIIKRILIGLLIIGLIPFVVAIFVKKQYAVEKDIAINKPDSLVFNYVKLLTNQDNYSKWANMDKDMEKTYTGIDGTVGFVSAWKSNKKDVGVGEQEIVKIEANRIDYELRFKEPFESTEKAFMQTQKLTDSTTIVTWGFNGHMKYPMNLMFLFMDFEKMIGDDLSVGLSNLKVQLEK